MPSRLNWRSAVVQPALNASGADRRSTGVIATVLLALLSSGFAIAETRPSDDGTRIVPADRPTVITDLRAVRDEGIARQLPLTLRTETGVIQLRSFVNGMPYYDRTLNHGGIDGADITISADDVHPGGLSGLSLTGAGVTVGVWDSGHAQSTHPEFVGRLFPEDQDFTGFGIDDHATHVSGTVGAAGAEIAARGIAYGARIESREWTSDDTEMQQAASRGMRISNHSYGLVAGWTFDPFFLEWYWFGDPSVDSNESFLFGLYTERDAAWDRVLNENQQYLAVAAAGNDRSEVGPPPGSFHIVVTSTGTFFSAEPRNPDGAELGGYDTVASPATAKNVLTVGAVEGVAGGYSSPTSVVMSTFSNWGPTDDGRIKPDLVAKGVDVYSPVTGSAYAFFNGTSMAAPGVTGGLALMLEHWRNVLEGRSDPRGATLKALAIHTADEADRPGPDYSTGWGLMNVRRAVETISAEAGAANTIDERSLVSGGLDVLYGVVDPAADEVRVTIAWADPAGNPPGERLDARTSMLVNDLNLRLVDDETGSILQPFVLDFARPNAPAETGVNRVDNVEQVRVPAALFEGEARLMRIEIDHDGSSLLGGGQNYSLVTTGFLTVTESLAPRVDASELVIDEGGEATLNVRLPRPFSEPTPVQLQLSGTGAKLANGLLLQENLLINVEPDAWLDAIPVRIVAPEDEDTCFQALSLTVALPGTGEQIDIPIQVIDDDLGIALTGAPTTPIDEGSEVNLGLRLSAAPCEPIAVDLIKASGGDAVALRGTSSFMFDESNWQTAAVFSLEALEDDRDMLDETAEFRVELTHSGGTFVADSIFLQVEDDDAFQVDVANGAPLEVFEGIAAETAVSLSLPVAPPKPCSFEFRMLSGSAPVDVRVPGSLRFTSSNFETPQFIFVTAPEDNDRVDEVVTIEARVISESTLINNQRLTFEVTLRDSFEPAVVATVSDLELINGTQATVDLMLNAAPVSGQVEVKAEIISGDRSFSLVGEDSFMFTDADFDQVRTLTVESVGDSNSIPNLGQLRITGDRLVPADVKLTEVETLAFGRPTIPLGPKPADRARDVGATVMLEWAPADLATSYDVYLADKQIPEADDFVGSTAETQIEVTGLAVDTTYRWRVFARNSAGLSSGPIWTFTTATAQQVDDNDSGNDAPAPDDMSDDAQDPADGDADSGDNAGGDTPTTPAPNDDAGNQQDAPIAPSGAACGLPLMLMMMFGGWLLARRAKR